MKVQMQGSHKTSRIIFLFLLCSFMLLFSLLAVHAKASTVASGTCGENLIWTLDDEGTLTISGTGEMPNYSYNGSAPWYSRRSDINNVTISIGVTSIGQYAFKNCTNMMNITIPDSVTTIWTGAFSDCSSLISISIPWSVTSIDRAFYDCSNLLNITVDSNNAHYSSQNGVLFNKDKTMLSWYSAGKTEKSYTIPTGVVIIDDDAFNDCTNLTNISIPDSVTSIRDYAFSGCNNLASISIPDSVTSIGVNAFGGCRSLSSITLPSGLTTIRNGTFMGCTNLTSITIPSSVTKIGEEAFFYCTKLTSINIPFGVTSIGIQAFCNCNLNSISIPSTVTSIGRGAFWGNSMNSISIPSSVTSIGESVFCFCRNLSSITLPSSITSIGEYAFSYCTSLNSISIPSSVTSIGKNAFEYCSNLTSITIPDSVTSIGDSAFYDCQSLISVCYHGTEKQWSNITIGENNELLLSLDISFVIVEGLLSNNISWSLDKVGKLIIYGTGNMPSVSSDSGWRQFTENIYSILIQQGITSICENAFSDCINLSYMTLPPGVTSIGNYAFYGCTNLSDIMIPESVTSFGAFPIPKNTTVYCYEFSYTESWATDNGYTVKLVDSQYLNQNLIVSLPANHTVMSGTTSRMGEFIFPRTENIQIRWTSSDSNVATISANGVLTAHKGGMTTITLQAGTKITQCTVTVIQKATDYDLLSDYYVIAKGTVQANIINLLPADADVDLAWSINDTVYATVSPDGMITGKAVGETQLTVTDSISGLSRTATIHICYPVQSISLALTENPVYAGFPTAVTALVTTTRGQSYVNKLVSFSSSNTNNDSLLPRISSSS